MFWAGCIFIIFGLAFTGVHFWGSQQHQRMNMGRVGRTIMELLEAVAITVILTCLLVASSPLLKALLG